MEVKFNGEKISVHVAFLGELLQEKGWMEKTGIAVAVNAAVVSKSKWATTQLQENDEIILITAAAGG